MQQTTDEWNAVSDGDRSRRDDASADPKWRAQELAYEALEASSRSEAARLAKEALELDPDCADAYVALADPSPSGDLEGAVQLVREGVQAGERAIGPDPFQQGVGRFWGILETRPYMRARQVLAQLLWLSGQKDEAVDHLQELLRLNEQDNQGVRYELVHRLLELGRTAQAGALFERFDDEPTCMWRFPKALWSFQSEGATAQTRNALREAEDANPFVVLEFMSKLMTTAVGAGAFEGENEDAHPDWYGIGGREEAREYWVLGLGAWFYTEGAMLWFLSEVKGLLGAVEKKSLRSRRKIGRNDPCPCGSELKYKRCCLR